MPTCNHCLYCHREGQFVCSRTDGKGKRYIHVDPVECYCRRYAPRPNVFDPQSEENETIWPRIYSDSWCGEFEPNPYDIATLDPGNSTVVPLYIGNDETEDLVATIGVCNEGFYCEKGGERETFDTVVKAIRAMHKGINDEVFPGYGR